MKVSASIFFGSIFSLVGIVFQLFDRSTTWSESLLYGSLLGIPAFIATWILIVRDERVWERRFREIKEQLSLRSGIDDDLFLSEFTDAQVPIAHQVRESLAKFFEVRVELFCGSDLLQRLGFEDFSPSLYLQIASDCCEEIKDEDVFEEPVYEGMSIFDLVCYLEEQKSGEQGVAAEPDRAGG